MVKNKVYAVFGLGSFGQSVASVLSNNGANVIVVDNNPTMVEMYKNKVTAALLLDTTDEIAMAKAPLGDIDIAIIALNSMEDSIVTTALLKKRGITYLVCRALSTIHAQVLRQIGANEVVNLQEDGGRRLAERLIAPEILNTVGITKNYSIAEFYVPHRFIDKPLANIDLTNKYNLRLVGIKRISVSVDKIGNPERAENLIYAIGDEILKEDDVLVLVGKNSDLDEFKALL
ncbi:MAG: potassium transporter TrkA [Treponema sp. CETP13]|nr:MAG: potassium transporter TrkA [Treponema sp. CETP13]